MYAFKLVQILHFGPPGAVHAEEVFQNVVFQLSLLKYDI